MEKEIKISEIGTVRIGHAQDKKAVTGCTAFIFDGLTPVGADIRGGGPASRENTLLHPLMAATGINAILLSGGSAFGLDAAGGVQKYLEEQGIGFDVGVAKVPLVCESCLFDLSVGSADVRPGIQMGYQAAKSASLDPPEEGAVGVGTGCTVGKFFGMDYASKSGFGSYALEMNGLKVGAAVAVNALGDIFDGNEQIAGLRSEDKTGFRSTVREMMNLIGSGQSADTEEMYRNTGNTTLGVILTNAVFDKNALSKIAGMAHNGYARAIRPVHTGADGDSIYAASVGTFEADLNTVGVVAAHVMEKAIVRAVRAVNETRDCSCS